MEPVMKETLIAEEEEEKDKKTSIKEKKKKQVKGGPEFAADELEYKLARAFNGAAFLLKSDITYREKDFEEEAKDLARMAKKYSILANILVFLDPLFLILGLFSKVKRMLERIPKKQKGTEVGGIDGDDNPPEAGGAFNLLRHNRQR